MSDTYVPRDPNAPKPKHAKPRSKNKLGCGIFIAPLLVLAFYGVMQLPHWHPGDDEYPVQGIDVSHHQGEIDWTALPGQNVDFAFIKATEGGDFVDKRFAENWRKAADVGIPRGAYHFFTLCRSGSEQADNFIATVPVAPDALPPVVDLEYMGNCSQRPKIADFNVELQAYLGKVEAHYGRQAIFYLTEEFDEAYGVSAKYSNPLWLRSIGREPRFGAREWEYWQVSNFRNLDGVEGRVDWNVKRSPK